MRPTLVRRLVLAATGPKGAPGMHGWRDDIAAAARGESKPENLLYIMFAHTEASQAKGIEFLGRFIERQEDRDAPTSDAARDAQYDAIVEWGIPDHAALQRLTGIKSPTLVIQGDGDLMIPTKLSHLMAGLIPDARDPDLPGRRARLPVPVPGRGRGGRQRIPGETTKGGPIVSISATTGCPGRSRRITVARRRAVLFAEISAPPMNLLGPELVRDLVSLIQRAEADDACKVLVFKSADPDYFISHVDLTQVAEYRAGSGEADRRSRRSRLLFRHLSASRLVTIAQIEGRVRSAGSEFVLACDMRFAARESAIFAQFESAFGQIPGGGATQYLARLMGRARALEVLLSAEDYDAELAERYGWINRALPASTLDDFVRALAQRIASFPAAGMVAIKDRVNAITLAPADDFRRDSDLFGEQVRTTETQRRIQSAIRQGLQTREAELELAGMLGALGDTTTEEA